MGESPERLSARLRLTTNSKFPPKLAFVSKNHSRIKANLENRIVQTNPEKVLKSSIIQLLYLQTSLYKSVITAINCYIIHHIINNWSCFQQFGASLHYNLVNQKSSGFYTAVNCMLGRVPLWYDQDLACFSSMRCCSV